MIKEIPNICTNVNSFVNLVFLLQSFTVKLSQSNMILKKICQILKNKMTTLFFHQLKIGFAYCSLQMVLVPDSTEWYSNKQNKHAQTCKTKENN